MMVNILLLTFGCGVLASFATSQETIAHEGCQLEKSIVKSAYVGWPTSISCTNLIAAHRRNTYGFGSSLSDNSLANCRIVDPRLNATLWNMTVDLANAFLFMDTKFITEDLTLNSTRVYFIILKTSNSSCFYNKLTLNITHQPDNSCLENQMSVTPVNLMGRQHSVKAMRCEAPYEETQIDLDDDQHSYSVTWYKNCTKIESNNPGYRIKGRQLVLSTLDFDKAGLYSCAITYKGKTRFPIQFSLCVQPPIHRSIPVMDCPKAVPAKVGESTKISCDVHVGLSSANTILIETKWRQVDKKSSSSCSNMFGVESSTGWNGRATCYTNVSSSEEHNDKCYLYEPSEEKKRPKKNNLKMTLEIRDVKKTDFGHYSVEYWVLNDKTNVTVRLIDASSPKSFYIYIIIGSSVLVGVILLVVMVLILRKCAKTTLSTLL